MCAQNPPVAAVALSQKVNHPRTVSDEFKVIEHPSDCLCQWYFYRAGVLQWIQCETVSCELCCRTSTPVNGHSALDRPLFNGNLRTKCGWVGRSENIWQQMNGAIWSCSLVILQQRWLVCNCLHCNDVFDIMCYPNGFHILCKCSCRSGILTTSAMQQENKSSSIASCPSHTNHESFRGTHTFNWS